MEAEALAPRIRTCRARCSAALLCFALGGGTAQAQAPLSAIDWLHDLPMTEIEPALPLTPPPGLPADPEGGDVGTGITMQPLDRPRMDSAGLFPAARVGLSSGLWGASTSQELAGLMALLPVDMLPALRDLTYRLLLAEFTPPRVAGPDPEAEAEAYLAARVGALMSFGAVDQAGALIAALEPVPLALQVTRFEIRLLLDEDEAACRELDAAQPPTEALPASLQAAQVFCRARSGDWDGADALLAELIDTREEGLDPFELDLLDRFIHFDEHADADLPAPVLPPRPGVLAWRLMEALGEPVGTLGLPLAFAHADLRGTAGWRAQIEAAERLVRAGALPPNRLLGLYTERRAAASGGIWERVRRVQALDAALTGGEASRIGAALLAVWPHFVEAELETAFAALFASQLMGAELAGQARTLAITAGLLSEDYELAALAIDAEGAPLSLRQLAAVARGLPPPEADRAGGALEAAVLAVFAGPADLPEDIARRLAEGRAGEELLRVLIRMGASGDPRMLAEGLAVLRRLGLEDIARRTALQALLLERRG